MFAPNSNCAACDMSSRDFLHKDAETLLCEYFVAGGAACSFSTNCETLLEAARRTFEPAINPISSGEFSIRIWIDNDHPARAPWPKPYVRGLGHMVFAGFDTSSSMLAELRTRRVIGRFSAGMANDSEYCQAVVFPILLTIVGASVGIAELHCGCVARNQKGVLLAGPSGAGKSTLALALAQKGFSYLSDDRTFCSTDSAGVQIWGLPTRLKLRPEAALWFEELATKQIINSPAGDSAFWLEPEHLQGVNRVRRCRATSIIFLQRRESQAFRLSPMSSTEVLSRLSRELMAELPEGAAKRSDTMRAICELPSWLLEYGGHPHKIAAQISQHFATS